MVAIIREPRSGLLHDIDLQRHVKYRSFFGNPLAVQHVELSSLERWSHLVLDDLDLGAIAYSLITILDGLDTSNIHADGRVELQRLAAGGRFRIAEEHTDLLSKLVDENGGGARLSQSASHLTQCLAHQSRLQTDVAVAHFTFDFGLRHQCSHGIDDDHVKRTRTNQHIRDFQRLLAVLRLGNNQRISIDAELARIDRVKRMFRIDERGDATVFLGIGHHMQRQCGLAGGFRTINLHDTALRQAADTQCHIQCQRSSRNHLDILLGTIA